MASNRDEDKILGMIDAQKRAKDRHEERVKNRDRDESEEKVDAEGNVRGRYVEYKTITLDNGETKRVKNVVRYFQSAEAVRHSKFKG